MSPIVPLGRQRRQESDDATIPETLLNRQRITVTKACQDLDGRIWCGYPRGGRLEVAADGDEPDKRITLAQKDAEDGMVFNLEVRNVFEKLDRKIGGSIKR